MQATITKIETDDFGNATVSLEWGGPDDHEVTDFDLCRLGTLVTGICPCGGNLRAGWVVLDGACLKKVGDLIPYVHPV